MKDEYDIVVVGSGPNGLTAAAKLASRGLKTLVVEAHPTAGGGTRTAPATLPGFRHDICSAVHPTGISSPAFRELKLTEFGLEWILPEISATHPIDQQQSVILSQNSKQTLESLDPEDRASYQRLIESQSKNFTPLFEQLLQPFNLKKNYLAHARFGLRGILPARSLANILFKNERAKALLAGCAAHSILPLDFWGTAATALVFLLSGHTTGWPVAKGGSQSICDSLLAALQHHGGEIICDHPIKSFGDLPPAKRYLFDLAPQQLASICPDQLPQRYLKRLSKYKYGPGVFKIDYALSNPIPWSDPISAKASTVHVGGSFDEIAAGERAAWDGKKSETPFVMVCQQSHFDPSRAPAGNHTGYAYCHVPSGASFSMAEQIEQQIERFAPGFRDCILEKRETTAVGMQEYNPAYVGGAIAGGATTLDQLFTRPIARIDPYGTPNEKIFICSHSTPPGGGVHGMCGYNAAGQVIKSLKR